MKIDQPHLSIPIETDKAGLLYLSKEIDAAKLMVHELESSRKVISDYLDDNKIDSDALKDKIDSLSNKILYLNLQIAKLSDIIKQAIPNKEKKNA